MAEFRKFVIEAAAVAIEKRWSAEDAAHLMSIDQHAFFAELAVVALRASAEAAKKHLATLIDFEKQLI